MTNTLTGKTANREPGSTDEAVMGFVAEIDGRMHKALIIKLRGEECFWWHWLMNPGPENPVNAKGGGLIQVFPKHQVFRDVKEVHGSRHKDGSVHGRVVFCEGSKKRKKGKIEGVGRTRTGGSIAECEGVRSFTIPLDSAGSWGLKTGPWSRVRDPIILRKCDFGSPGAWLHLYLCNADAVEEFVSRQHSPHWVAGHGTRKIVVIGEPYPPAVSSK